MRETPVELVELQALLDRSHSSAGAHLRSIFPRPARAERLATALDGIFEMHLAVLAGDGAPLVAPIDGILFHGRVWFGLPGRSLRARLIRRDTRVSASYNSGTLAFMVHGVVTEAETQPALSREFELTVQSLYTEAYGPGWPDWHREQLRRAREGGQAPFAGFIEPRVMFAQTERDAD